MSMMFRFSLVCVASLALQALWSHTAMAVESRVAISPFGKSSSGESVQQFALTNATGMQVKLIELGATISEVSVPE